MEAVAADAVLARATARGTAYVYAAGGRVWWKAVSKTATWGTSGKAARAPRMPSRLAGLCSGASGTSSSIAATTSSSMTTGSVNVGTAVDHPVADGEQAEPAEVGPVLPQGGAGGVERLGVVAAGDVLLVGPARRTCAGAGRVHRSARRGRSRAVSPVSASSTWYLSEDDPALTTRTGRGVGHQAPAWTAVMATVLTMSRTRAPRDRSLTGRLSPWSTGPIATADALRCTAL